MLNDFDYDGRDRDLIDLTRVYEATLDYIAYDQFSGAGQVRLTSIDDSTDYFIDVNLDNDMTAEMRIRIDRPDNDGREVLPFNPAGLEDALLL